MEELTGTLIIDRIEGDIIVIEVDGEKMQDISKNCIIGPFKEGDILVKDENGKLKVDAELTKKRIEEVQKKYKKLWK
ncbi:hypothetical protein M9Y10_002095 [Tritrichomonas musculus]|uniref:DUF3006 domain-containing protein n=1 Tax=Tritrichomonas musculus TaxID=1915356 RepID=A0ABR2L8W0_9EUKA